MDFIIIIANLAEQERAAFEMAFHKFLSEDNESILIFWEEEDKCVFQDYHEVSDEFDEALRAFLKSVSPKVETHKRRTMGFGEDRPRYSHENGRFVENYY